MFTARAVYHYKNLFLADFWPGTFAIPLKRDTVIQLSSVRLVCTLLGKCDLCDISDIPGRIELGEVGSNIPDISCVGEYQLDQDQL